MSYAYRCSCTSQKKQSANINLKNGYEQMRESQNTRLNKVDPTVAALCVFQTCVGTSFVVTCCVTFVSHVFVSDLFSDCVVELVFSDLCSDLFLYVFRCVVFMNLLHTCFSYLFSDLCPHLLFQTCVLTIVRTCCFQMVVRMCCCMFVQTCLLTCFRIVV
jgi:hypothetical protein